MSSMSNPLTGSGWTPPPASGNSLFPNPIGGAGAPPGVGSGGLMGGGYGNPGGFSNPKGSNEINRNMGLTNIEAGQMKNQLAPMFAQLMQQYGGQAGDFFTQLMNLGSPFYKQKQQEAFTQGVGQNQNAAALAQQKLQSQGYGSTPSGANAAMIGGMAQQGSQNLAEQYLQNLFQNENMQLGGAQGLAGMASLFNPTQLLGGTGVGANIQNQPSFFQNFDQIMQGIGALGGGVGGAASGIKGNG